MGAVDELRGGEPGQATMAVLRRAASWAARRFTPPADHREWSTGALDDLAANLLENKQHIFARALIVGIDNDDALEAYLRSAFDNFLKDGAKATDVGKLRRRLVTVLGNDERFVHETATGETWVLLEHHGSTWSGELTMLHAAAGKVRGVFIDRLNTAGPTPALVQVALRTVAHSVLQQAAGAVLAQDLAQVVWDRFFPTNVLLESLDAPRGERVADPRPGPDIDVLVRAAAFAVFRSLGNRERLLVPYLDMDDEHLRGLIDGVGQHETAAIAAAVRTKIALAVVDDAESEQVVLALLDLCRAGE